MLKHLLPAQLVAPTRASSAASPHAGALSRAFQAAYPFIRQAAWWSLPISLCGLLPSIFLLQVFDRVIYRNATSTLWALLSGVLCFLVLEYWLRTRRSRLLRDAGATLDHGVSHALMQSMLSRPLRALESRPASAWFLLFRDVSAVRATLTSGLTQALFDLPMALFALAVIALVAWPVLPVVLLFLVVMGFLAWWWADEVRAGKVEETQRSRSLERMTSEICQARETLKTQANDGPSLNRWRDSYAHWLAESFRKNGEIEQARDGTTVLLVVFSTVTITVGAVAVMQQWMTVGGLIASNMLAIKALQPVAGLVSNWRALALAAEAADRLETVLAEPVEPASQNLNLPQPPGVLTLQDLSFAFDAKQPPVLERVSLRIGAGGLHVIVGRNGAGKSTLAKLLAGLYRPTHGSLQIGEYELAQFGRADLADWISYLPQDTYWFAGELIDGLRRNAPGHSDEQIIGACRLSGAHDFISRLPAGYATQVGEGGTGLSIGQRRKLALALAFLRNPSVLILDEPSNDLDFLSEQQLLRTLLAVARQRTVIVVTHSLRIVSAATQVYHVTGQGNVEQGSAAVMVPRLFGVKPTGPVTPQASSPAQAGAPASAPTTAPITTSEAPLAPSASLPSGDFASSGANA